jgi:hypothetical protein
LMVSMLYDVLELKKVLPKRRNFLFFGEFLYLCGCVTPFGSWADTACRVPTLGLALLVRTLRPSVPTFGTRFARSDTACRVPTFWVVVYDFLLSLIAKSPYMGWWGVLFFALFVWLLGDFFVSLHCKNLFKLWIKIWQL